MAEFSVRGYVSSIDYDKDRVKVIVNEYKKGYKTKDTDVPAKNIKWSIHFPRYFTRYIPNNFRQGNLVEIKGEITKEGRKEIIIGQTMNLYSIRDIAKELKLERFSKRTNQIEKPHIDDFQLNDFDL